MKERSESNFVNLAVGILAIINVIIHIVFSYNLEFHRDELLYFSLGQHPAFGYETVPPMIGWIAYAMQSIFGYTLFAARIFPAFLSGLMVILVSSIAKELGGSGYARILSAIGISVSIFNLRTFILFQPVHIDLFLWTLLFYLIIKFINTSSEKYLISIGAIAGIAMLNKYLIGLLLVLLLVIVAFTKYRVIFTKKKFWYGILAGSLIFLPNMIWQVTNNMPVIGHLTELKRTQLVNVDKTAFMLEQLLIPAAASILTIAGLIYFFVSKRAIKYRFLGITAIGVIFIIMLLRGKSYYTIGIFPFLISAGAVAWDFALKRIWAKIFIPFLLIILTVPILPIGIPVFKAEGLVKYFRDVRNNYGMDFVCRFEDNSIHSLPQDYADMLGWEELAKVANQAWQMISDKSTAFIYCENYGQAGAITIIGKKYRLPEAISFNESFKYWIPENFDHEMKSIVYINNEMGDDVRGLFNKITLVGSITNPDAREYGTKVYLCEGPESSFNAFWAERIKHFK